MGKVKTKCKTWDKKLTKHLESKKKAVETNRATHRQSIDRLRTKLEQTLTTCNAAKRECEEQLLHSPLVFPQRVANVDEAKKRFDKFHQDAKNREKLILERIATATALNAEYVPPDLPPQQMFEMTIPTDACQIQRKDSPRKHLSPLLLNRKSFVQELTTEVTVCMTATQRAFEDVGTGGADDNLKVEDAPTSTQEPTDSASSRADPVHHEHPTVAREDEASGHSTAEEELDDVQGQPAEYASEKW